MPFPPQGGGGGSSPPSPPSPSALGPYDYYINNVSGTYTATDHTGTSKFTSATPDIWALLNSIDGGQSAGAITKIYIQQGIYTGSTVFAPGLNKGYIIVGDGTAAGSVYSQEGTNLVHTGTGIAIDGNTNWATPMTTNTAQRLELWNLAVECDSASGEWLRLTNAASSLISNCKFQTSSTAAVSGSIAISYPTVSNIAPHYLRSVVFDNAGATQVKINADFVWIDGMDVGVCGTGARACIDIEAGETHSFSKVNIGYNGGSPAFSLAPVYDNRPATTMEDGQVHLLTMFHLTGETTAAIYENVNGAYFVIVGLVYSGGTPYLDYATNIPTCAYAQLAANVTNTTATDQSSGSGVTLFANFAKSVIGGSLTQWKNNYNSAFRVRGSVQLINSTVGKITLAKVYRSTTSVPAAGSGINAGDAAVWSFNVTQPTGNTSIYTSAFDFVDSGLSIATQYYYYTTLANVTGGTSIMIGSSTAPNATTLYAEAI